MVIIQGLFNNMVLQRCRGDISDAIVEGECKSDGTIYLRVEKDDKPLKKLSSIAVGKAKTGHFSAILKGIPVGGPYSITLSIENKIGASQESIKVRNICVGDVWVLAGQSNMEGVGLLKHALKPHQMVRAFHMNDIWGIARDPLHVLGEAVDQVHINLNGGVRAQRSAVIGTGPGLSFAQEILNYSKVPQGLICCAHGGTSMEQWDPSKKSLEGKSLYGAMIRRFKKNGGKVAGVVWYQGCSDTNENDAHMYTDRMKKFVSSIRKDFSDKNLPFIAVQIATVCEVLSSPRYWNSIQNQQRLLPKVINNMAVVPSIDLALDDGIHISGFDQIRVGKRCAQAMAVLKKMPSSGKSPVSFRSVKSVRNNDKGNTDFVIQFDNVTGTLESRGRPEGFTLSDKPYEVSQDYIYRIDLHKDTAILRTGIPFNSTTSPLFLYYGFGKKPYCNITDSKDRSLPVFGPTPALIGKAVTPFVTTLLVSKFQPSSGNLNSLKYPDSLDSLILTKRSFEGNFCNLHQDILTSIPDDHLVYYCVKLKCTEPMQLKLDLGYDGPIKMWVDKKEFFHDPEGTNPALAGDALISFSATAGEHEVLVALGTNHGAAWGIFLRCERDDLDQKVIKKGREFYSLPEFICS